MEQIVVRIKKDGTVEIEAVGFKGSACREATRPLEEALGEVVEERLKPEFYEVSLENENNLYLGGSLD
jgi:hypothetical protein